MATKKPGFIRIRSMRALVIGEEAEAKPGILQFEPGFSKVSFVHYDEAGAEVEEDMSDLVHGVNFRHVAGKMSELTLTVFDAELLVEGADRTQSVKATKQVLDSYAEPKAARPPLVLKAERLPDELLEYLLRPETKRKEFLDQAGLSPSYRGIEHFKSHEGARTWADALQTAAPAECNKIAAYWVEFTTKDHPAPMVAGE